MNSTLKDALGVHCMAILLTLLIERYILLSVAEIIFWQSKKKKDNDVPTCRHCKGDHVSCTNKCDYFKSAKKIENQKQIGKITLNESIKLYNSLNKKIIPKLDEELILDKDVIRPNNY